MDVGCRASKNLHDIAQVLEQSSANAAMPLTEPFGVSNDVLFSARGSEFYSEVVRF